MDSVIDRFAMSAWLKVYYREVADRPDFAAKSAANKWESLRAHVLADNPPNDRNRREAIDGIRQREREGLLDWLEKSK